MEMVSSVPVAQQAMMIICDIAPPDRKKLCTALETLKNGTKLAVGQTYIKSLKLNTN